MTSGMLNLSRNLRLITGASMMGALFSLAGGTVGSETATPDATATAMHVTFLAAAVLTLTALTIAKALAPPQHALAGERRALRGARAI
ncbi:MAG: hypothetical protein WKF96_20410 [Solirubrobacteraceae bacterium]